MGEGSRDLTVDENGVKWGSDEYGPYRINDRAWTMNEIRDHPMFMEDVPSDISDNPYLLALQSILYDGNSPEDMAEHFRKLGNEAFRSSTNKMSSQNALMAYTKGLEMDCKDQALNSQLYSNRAAVSLRLKEYDKAIDDCRKALKLDPTNTKAHYRGAKASESLGLTEQALRFCTGALEHKPDDQELQQMRAKLERQLLQEAEQHKSRRKEEALDSEQHALAAGDVQVVLEAREVRVGPILFDVAMYFQGRSPHPKLVPGASDAVQWPLLLLYDETSQSDFVETFDERCALNEQLQMMFPEDRRVDWDDEGKYVWDRLVTYLEHYPDEGSGTRMRRMDAAAPLQDVLRSIHVPRCIVLHILVAGSGAHACFCREQHLPPP